LLIDSETPLFSQTFSVSQRPFRFTTLNADTGCYNPDTISVWL
jgi:hypothetical protein